METKELQKLEKELQAIEKEVFNIRRDGLIKENQDRWNFLISRMSVIYSLIDNK